MKNKRFEYRYFSRCIKDNKTGYLHYDMEDITRLLNSINDKADENANDYFDCGLKRIKTFIDNEYFKRMYYDVQKIAIENLEENLEYRKIMKKHGIKSLERLDHILFYARKW